jgi:sulfoxide reductase heme-binding subunit YedZ
LYGKPVVFVAALLPLLWLTAGAFGVGGVWLGANPVKTIQHTSGIWALRFLMLTLTCTPLRWLLGQAWPLQLRRMLGLFTYTYASLHFLNYLLLDRALDMQEILGDITKRPYIIIGFTALLMMTPLAITSTAGWQRRLRSRWLTLHSAIYLIAMLGCWHFYWQVKKDVREPLVYCGILAVLLGYRLWKRRPLRGTSGPRATVAPPAGSAPAQLKSD